MNIEQMRAQLVEFQKMIYTMKFKAEHAAMLPGKHSDGMSIIDDAIIFFNDEAELEFWTPKEIEVKFRRWEKFAIDFMALFGTGEFEAPSADNTPKVVSRPARPVSMKLQQVKWTQHECASQIAYAERQLKKEFAFMARGSRRNVMKEVESAIAEIEQAARLGSKNLFTVIGAFYDAQTPEAAAVILRQPMNSIYGKRTMVPEIIDNLFMAAEAIEQPGEFTQLEARVRINKMPDAHAFFSALAKHMGKS